MLQITLKKFLFSFFLLWLNIFCTSMGLAIRSEPSASKVLERAESPGFFTRYDLFDQGRTRKDSKKIDGPGHLKPVADVFMAMNTASPTSPPLGQTISTGPTLLDVISTTPAKTALTPTPFFGGPGPVILPPLKPSPTPGLDGLSVGDNANATATSSRHFLVLGTIAGGILFFTFCVFLIMSPSCNGSFCGWVNLKKTSKSEKAKVIEDQEKTDTSSWIIVPSVPPPTKRSSFESVKDVSNPPKEDIVLDVVSALASSDEDDRTPTASKFSMCSSEYPPSSCSSTTDLASNSSTVKAYPLSHPSSIPVRPPRPPTADSPALSDSVYLAFSSSDQPYVLVQPQTLSMGDFQVGRGPESPRRLLTSTEFAALHTGDHFSSNIKRTSSDSRHSRTKSAPSLGRRNKSSAIASDFVPSKLLGTRKSCITSWRKPTYESLDRVDEGGDVLEDIENDSDVQKNMVRKVMKHRRSRSASGWAYPKGKRTRRPFRLEE